jgi:cold shock protein
MSYGAVVGAVKRIRGAGGVLSAHGRPSGPIESSRLVVVQGKVKYFDRDRGFGFISRDGGDDVFVHVSNLQGDGEQALAEGQAVEFDIGPGRKSEEARNVRAI